jgi:hypothetical protein
LKNFKASAAGLKNNAFLAFLALRSKAYKRKDTRQKVPGDIVNKLKAP